MKTIIFCHMGLFGNNMTVFPTLLVHKFVRERFGDDLLFFSN